MAKVSEKERASTVTILCEEVSEILYYAPQEVSRYPEDKEGKVLVTLKGNRGFTTLYGPSSKEISQTLTNEMLSTQARLVTRGT